MSGRSDSIFVTASAPFSASPMTSTSPNGASMRRSRFRASSSSSTINVRIIFIARTCHRAKERQGDKEKWRQGELSPFHFHLISLSPCLLVSLSPYLRSHIGRDRKRNCRSLSGGAVNSQPRRLAVEFDK